eukprot:6476734-Heterocapsa_arctica.AAC.1
MNFANIRAIGVVDPQQGPQEIATKFGLGITIASLGGNSKYCISFPTDVIAAERIEQLQNKETWECLESLVASRLEEPGEAHFPTKAAN